MSFYPILRSASTIEIHFTYDQKSRFDLVEKIKNEYKNRTRASLFQSSEDRKREFFYVAIR